MKRLALLFAILLWASWRPVSAQCGQPGVSISIGTPHFGITVGPGGYSQAPVVYPNAYPGYPTYPCPNGYPYYPSQYPGTYPMPYPSYPSYPVAVPAPYPIAYPRTPVVVYPGCR